MSRCAGGFVADGDVSRRAPPPGSHFGALAALVTLGVQAGVPAALLIALPSIAGCFGLGYLAALGFRRDRSRRLIVEQRDCACGRAVDEVFDEWIAVQGARAVIQLERWCQTHSA